MSKETNKPFLRQKFILEFIITLVEANPDQETFYVDPVDLESHSPLLRDINSLKIAFEEIAEKTKKNITFDFQNYKNGMTTAGGETGYSSKIIIHIEDVEKLNEYYGKLIDSPNENKIEKLSLFKNKDGELKIIINDNYNEKDVLSADAGDKSWNLLFRIGEEEEFVIGSDGCKTLYDYVNSNDKCILYSKTNYPLTKILSIDRGKLKSNIKIEILGNKAYQQRINKLNDT